MHADCRSQKPFPTKGLRGGRGGAEKPGAEPSGEGEGREAERGKGGEGPVEGRGGGRGKRAGKKGLDEIGGKANLRGIELEGGEVRPGAIRVGE